jgi:hypothetical protein
LTCLICSGKKAHASREDNNPLKASAIDSIFQLISQLLTILDVVSGAVGRKGFSGHELPYLAALFDSWDEF